MLAWMARLIHQCGAEVLIEGVEECSEALVALDCGADYLQGYYLAMPKPGAHIDPIAERILAELTRLSLEDRVERMREYQSFSPKNMGSTQEIRTLFDSAMGFAKKMGNDWVNKPGRNRIL